METKEYGVALLRSLTDQPVKPENWSAGQTAEKSDSIRNDGGLATELDIGSIPQPVAKDHCQMIASASAIKPLCKLLVDGSPIAQRDACGALANIARGRTEYQERIIQAGGVTAMAALLRTGDASAQEQATAALSSVSQHESSRGTMITAGAVPPLVNLLKVNGRSEAQIRAAEALANLATLADGQAVVAKGGAIPRLIELLAAGKAQEATSRALARLAHGNLQNQTDICKLGGISRLLPSLNGVNIEAQVQAASALAELAGGERCRRRQDAIAKAGGIRPLLALIESRYSRAQCMALHALAEMSTNNRANQNSIAELGGTQPLVTLISAGSAPAAVQTYAAQALAQFVKHNETNQSAVAELGAISLLVSLMRQTSTPAIEAEVAGTLHALGEGHPANQASIVSAGAISALVGLLGSRSDHAARLAGNALSSLGLDNRDSQTEIAKLLVNLLTTAKREATQERASAALWRLVRQNPGDQMSIASAGGADSLVRLLRDGAQGGKAYALWSLSLCIRDENRQVCT